MTEVVAVEVGVVASQAWHSPPTYASAISFSTVAAPVHLRRGAAESDAGVVRSEKVLLAQSVDEKGFELDRILLEISLATQHRDAESAVAAEAKAALAVLQDQRIEKLSESDAGAELKSLMAQVRALESTKAGIEKDSTAQSQRVEQLLLSERELQQGVVRGQQKLPDPLRRRLALRRIRRRSLSGSSSAGHVPACLPLSAGVRVDRVVCRGPRQLLREL